MLKSEFLFQFWNWNFEFDIAISVSASEFNSEFGMLILVPDFYINVEISQHFSPK
jgi:hypothetical protein